MTKGVGVMSIIGEKVQNYRNENQCSIFEARTAVLRDEQRKSIEEAETLEELKEAILYTLDFEFGGYC